MSIAPSSTAGTGPSSPLLQLPTLIRDEILGHLFPPSNNIWLVRPGASAHSWSYQLIANAAAEEHFEYYNAFWRRRQIEQAALANWFAGSRVGATDVPLLDGKPAADDRAAARGFLALRLVCRKLAVEVSALLFRRATLCWSVWGPADVQMLEVLRREWEGWRKVRDGRANGGIGGGSCAQATEVLGWPHALYGCPTTLAWVSRFRRIRVFAQDASLADVLAGLGSMLAASDRPLLGLSLPTVELVVCGFELVFDREELSWQARLPEDDFAGRVLAFRWDEGEEENGGGEGNKAHGDVGGRRGRRRLVVDKLNAMGECDFWSLGGLNTWLDDFEFCNKPFTTEVSFGEEPVDMKGNLVFYTYKREEDKSIEFKGV